MLMRALFCIAVFVFGSPALSCPLPDALNSFDETITANSLPEIGNTEPTKAQARLLLVRLEEFRQVHLEGYRKALGSYGAYIIETDKTLEKNRMLCSNQYDNLHNMLVDALQKINGGYRNHYRNFIQRYKTRVKFARQVIFF